MNATASPTAVPNTEILAATLKPEPSLVSPMGAEPNVTSQVWRTEWGGVPRTGPYPFSEFHQNPQGPPPRAQLGMWSASVIRKCPWAQSPACHMPYRERTSGGIPTPFREPRAPQGSCP